MAFGWEADAGAALLFAALAEAAWENYAFGYSKPRQIRCFGQEPTFLPKAFPKASSEVRP